MSDAEATIHRFIKSFSNGDFEAMGDCVTEDLKAYITNAEGGVNLLSGRDAFVESVGQLDVKTVQPTLTITQILKIADDQYLFMIEVKAERKGRHLHNFAAYLTGFEAGRIKSLHMVEALPQYSDAFWKD